MFVSPYDILGVEKYCSEKELNKAYSKLYKKTLGTSQNNIIQQAYNEIKFLRSSENTFSPFRGSSSLRLFDNSSLFEPFERAFSNMPAINFNIGDNLQDQNVTSYSQSYSSSSFTDSDGNTYTRVNMEYPEENGNQTSVHKNYINGKEVSNENFRLK